MSSKIKYVLAKDCCSEVININNECIVENSWFDVLRNCEYDHVSDYAKDQSIEKGGTSLYSIDSGYLLIGEGIDGVLVDRSGRFIKETALFADENALVNIIESINSKINGPEINQACICFDQSFSKNYFHTLFFAAFLKTKIKAFVQKSHGFIDPLKYKSGIFDKYLSICSSVDLEIKMFLSPGVYKISNAIFPAAYPENPIYNIYTNELFTNFRSNIIQKFVIDREDQNNLIFVSRRKSGEQRIAENLIDYIEEELTIRKFKVLYLEEMSFEDQVKSFHSASVVVGVHGAGLSNILFCRKNTHIFELNSYVSQESKMRPWFGLLSILNGLKYNSFNTTVDNRDDLLLGIDNAING